MINELLLGGSLLLLYGGVLAAWRCFGRAGLYGATVLATVLANVEVLLLFEGFGLVQTGGNILFAATYLATDILSENEGPEAARKAVKLGAWASAAMLLITRSWLLYTPATEDWAAPAMGTLFSMTPRLLAASFLAYVLSQRLDVLLYQKIWDWTAAKWGREAGLWIRNNCSTLLSQLVNTVLFTLLAFAGVYRLGTLLSVMGSSYLIYGITAILDTPAVYLARRMKRAGKIPTE